MHSWYAYRLGNVPKHSACVYRYSLFRRWYTCMWVSYGCCELHFSFAHEISELRVLRLILSTCSFPHHPTTPLFVTCSMVHVSVVGWSFRSLAVCENREKAWWILACDSQHTTSPYQTTSGSYLCLKWVDSHVSVFALIGGGVRVRVWISEERKIKRRSKALLSVWWQTWTSTRVDWGSEQQEEQGYLVTYHTRYQAT